MLEQELEKAFDMWASYYGKEQDFIDAVEKDCKAAGYGEFLLFNIEKFNGKKWPKYLLNKLQQKDEYHKDEYFVNNAGWPVKEVMYSDQWHARETVYFIYTETETIQIRFRAGNMLPNAVEKIEWKNGGKISYRSFHVNGGIGSHEEDFKIAESAVKYLKANNTRFIVSSEYFNHDDKGKIENVLCYRNSPGIGAFQGYKTYEYENDILQRIVSYMGDWPPKIEYFKRESGFKIKKFLIDLSDLFYMAICEKLLTIKENSPVALLDISYQSVGNYWPYIIYATEQDIANFKSSDRQLFFHAILWSAKTFDINSNDELKQHFSILEEFNDKDYTKEYGEKMWYLFAKKLNEEKHNYKNLSKNFFVFTHGDLGEFGDVELKKNGATKEQLKYWKSQGFL